MIPAAYKEPLERFFSFMFQRLPPGSLIETRVINGVVHRSFHLTTNQLVDYITSTRSARENLYFGVVPRTHTSGTAASLVPTWNILWADLDEKHGSKFDDIINSPLPAPCAIVGSGHGWHCYWKLREPVTLPIITEANRNIAALLNSDHVGDPARIMRIPYSINKKPGQPEIRADLIRFMPDCEGHYFTSFTGDSSTDYPTRAKRVRAMGPLPEGHVSRSEKLFAIAVGFVIEGKTDLNELMARMYAVPEGEKLDEMSPTRRKQWIELTYKNAKRTIFTKRGS